MAITVSVYRRRYWVKRKDGRRVKRLSPTYTVEFRDHDGRLRRVRAYPDKLASEQMAADIRKRLARGEQGLVDAYSDHKRRPLSEHVAEYVADLKSLGRDPMYTYNIEKRLGILFDGCGWSVLADIEPNAFAKWRQGRSEQLGGKTLNQYLETARAFCTWCVRRNRMATNPLAHVGKVEVKRKRLRRALTLAEIHRLLSVAPNERRIVYLTTLATGLRRQELRDLAWGDVRLVGPTPHLKLRADKTKARRSDSIALKSEVADELRAWRPADAAETDRVFPTVPSTIPDLRDDLAAAGIEYEQPTETPGVFCYADLHGQRKTLGTLLNLSGAPERVAMEQMRLTDRRLLDEIYTDTRVFGMSAAIERLPQLLPDPTKRPGGAGQAVRVSVRVANPNLDLTQGIPENTAGPVLAGPVRSGATGDNSGSTGVLGFEPIENHPVSAEKPAVSGAVCVPMRVRHAEPTDPDLKIVIDAWPNLSADIRRSILHVVRASRKR